MRYFGADGTAFSLGQRIAAGGEGAVFEVDGRPDLVAKIYHVAPSHQKAGKLAAMAAMADGSLSAFAAWPTTTLHQIANAPLSGILMPRVTGARAIHELDTPAHRRANFPQADWRFLVRTAKNCAIAVAALHHRGIVIGDINQNGFLVTKDALVRLIDCDSFQLRTANRTFLCEVAVPEFLPPELHGASLATTYRTANHDSFGLSILIFRLLMLGRHPFAGYRGHGDKPIPEAIKEFRFAFGPDAQRMQMAAPPHSLLLPDLPNEVANNFIRAFSRGSERDGARPTAAMWAESLARLEAQFESCTSDPGHYFPSGINGCPWCRIEAGSGPSYFLSVTIQKTGASSAVVDITSLILQIDAMAKPAQVLSGLIHAAPVKCKGAPLPQGIEQNREKLQVIAFVTLGAGAISFLSVLHLNFFYISVCATAILALAWLTLYLRSPYFVEKRRRQRCANETRQVLAAAEHQAKASLNQLSDSFDHSYQEATRLKDRFASLQKEEAAELNKLNLHAQDRQLEEFLDRFFIRDASINGIGKGRVATLESFGVETAADVDQWKIRGIPGFGDAYTSRLISWRRSLEAKFRFDPAKGVPQSDLLKLRNKYLQQRHAIKRQLEVIRSKLSQVSNEAKQDAERACSSLSAKRLAAAQASADLELCL